MSKRHVDVNTTLDENPPKRRKLSADKVLVEAAKKGDTTAVRAGFEKLSPDTDSKSVVLDAAREACRGNHDECLTLLLPYVETTQMGFGNLLSECVHADHVACTEVLLQHWKSVCSNVAMVPHGQENTKGRACLAMWADPAVCQVLIDAGADIETKDDMGRSPLHWACLSGVFAVVKLLVKTGAGMRGTDNFGNTSLICASHHGHTDIVRYLVGLKEVDVDHKSDNGCSALVSAVCKRHTDVMEVLIAAGADIETKGIMGRSPLLTASEAENVQIVKMLVKAGADVRVTDDQGTTSLILAACFGNTDIVRYLVGLPQVDLNHKDNDGYTALYCAAGDNHADVVEVLIDAGADIEAKDDMGRPPLYCACRLGNLAVVKLFVKAGGVRATDNEGTTCLMYASEYGHTETVRYLVGLLEVDVNASNTRGSTSLHLAVLQKHSDVVQVLIDAGADVEAKDDNGRPPLHCACLVGYLKIVQMLVEADADVCEVDDKSDRCLSVSACHGDIETVRYLVGLPEVDVNHRNLLGHTALDHATVKQHADVVQVLLEHRREVFAQ